MHSESAVESQFASSLHLYSLYTSSMYAECIRILIVPPSQRLILRTTPEHSNLHGKSIMLCLGEWLHKFVFQINVTDISTYRSV